MGVHFAFVPREKECYDILLLVAVMRGALGTPMCIFASGD